MMMRKISKPFVFRLFVLILLSLSSAHSQNFLTNGGFESGGSGTGFLVTSPFSLAITPGTSVQVNYAIVTNPSLMNSSFISGDTIFMNLNWVSLPFLRFTNLFKK